MAQVGSRPVKPKYWFEEFGDYWSCSCGHINKGETCVGCGLNRGLLRRIFILHKPASSQSSLGTKIQEQKEQIDKEAAYHEAMTSRVQANASTDLNNIRPIEEFGDDVDVDWGKASPSEDADYNSDVNCSGEGDEGIVYTTLDDQLPEPAEEESDGKLIPVPQLPTVIKKPKLPGLPKKKLHLAIIIVAALVLLSGVFGFVKFIAAPAQDYDEAVAAMEAGNYEQAIEMFQALGDYSDSMMMIRQCYIEMGNVHFEAGEFEDAITDYETAQDLAETGDVADLIRNCYIGIGDKYQEESQLKKAIEAYRKAQEINKTENIREEIRVCFIGIGDKRLADDDYENAFKAYDKAQNIKETEEVKDKINAVKYAYVSKNMDNRGETVEKYLDDLMAKKYPGAKELYDKYYEWHAKIVANGSADDFKNKKKTFTKAETVFFHTKLSGGKPDEKIKLYYTLQWPTGQVETQMLGDEWKSGAKITAQFMYPMPMFGVDGKMTFTVYDRESNKELAKCTVNIKD
ncbi:MAG: tetratricopeptide repeat protein [Eubacterium sp.]|nr:tetratricopeptide repeat protein [Candidatus Colimonas fimequi]